MSKALAAILSPAILQAIMAMTWMAMIAQINLLWYWYDMVCL
jgi:hypothetical protein